ncbi:MAG: LPS assembly lipoprotein LptE [Bryobacterales bacterium]|nr:LPS assembly lipoprotein LptE [Bryobacterales bacterium]
MTVPSTALKRIAAAMSSIACALSVASCGYRVVGTADFLPDRIRTIAVPAFTNVTSEFKIEQQLTAAVVSEVLQRTRYQVVSRPDEADATLVGRVMLFDAIPQNFDPSTGRATAVMTVTRVHVALYDRADGSVLYTNPDMVHRENYEVSDDPEAYVNERDAAIERASRSMAASLVSAVLSGF